MERRTSTERMWKEELIDMYRRRRYLEGKKKGMWGGGGLKEPVGKELRNFVSRREMSRGNRGRMRHEVSLREM